MSFRKVAVAVSSVALALTMAGEAGARPGDRGSMGSRGARTYTAPQSTTTAPGAAAPMQRSVTPQSAPQPGMGQMAGQKPGFFSGGFGRGLLGGLIGAGLFGMLFGNGLMGGLGGMMSFLGLALQLALLFFVGRWLFNMWRSRNPAMAGVAPQMNRDATAQNFGAQARNGAGPLPGGAAPAAPLTIEGPDYQAFEKRLHDVQTAYSNEDIGAIRSLTTPEMASYLEGDIAKNQAQGLVNKISEVRLLKGDLSEAWRETNTEYATVAMRFALCDAMIERASGRLVSGSTTAPEEAVELWTFRRPTGAKADAWRLSAIQQTS
jgi:predicted lipid-binding transport protein (Tim44 family)